MGHGFRESWDNVLTSVDEAIRTLAEISLSPGGRGFLNNLERGEAGLCVELLDRVRAYLTSFLILTLLKLRRAGADEALTWPSHEAIFPHRAHRISQTSQKIAGFYRDNR